MTIYFLNTIAAHEHDSFSLSFCLCIEFSFVVEAGRWLFTCGKVRTKNHVLCENMRVRYKNSNEAKRIMKEEIRVPIRNHLCAKQLIDDFGNNLGGR